jgi:hypothetical protein
MINYAVPMSGPFGQFTVMVLADSWGSAIAIAESLYEESSPVETQTDLERLIWSKLESIQ